MTKTIISAFDQDAIIINGNGVNFTVATANRFNGFSQQTTAADLDERKYIRYFSKSGTYRMKYIHIKAINRAIIDMGINKSGSIKNTTNLLNQFDMFNSSTLNNEEQFVLIEIPRGYNDINIKTNGRNVGNSTDFLVSVQAIFFELIAEHSVLGEEAPAQDKGNLLATYEETKITGTTTGIMALSNVKKNKYKKIQIEIAGESNDAFDLWLEINQKSDTNYVVEYQRILAGVETQIYLVGQNRAILADSTLVNGADIIVNSIMVLTVPDNEKVVGRLNAQSSRSSNIVGGFVYGIALTDITSILVRTSANAWKQGWSVKVYGVK